MAVDVKTYDPAQVEVVVGGLNISGFAPGTMVELVPDAPPFREDFGVDGEPVRWAVRNPFDTLTLNLAQSSPSNFILSNFLNLDIATHAVVVPIMILDGNTEGIKSLYVAGRGWVTGPPAIVFAGGTPTARRWVLKLVNTFYNTQGMEGTPAISV